MFPPRRRRGQKVLRVAGVSAIGFVILLLLAAGAVVLFFDPNTLKPRIIAAVKRETGRDLDIKGRIGLSFSLTPTIQASDITFANAPGGTSPEMASVQRAEAQFSLLPLLSHRLVIERLVLLQPHVLLERGTDGVVNWRFSPPAAGGPAADPNAADAKAANPNAANPNGANPNGAGDELRLAIKSVHIRDGEIRMRPMGGLGATVIAIARLDATSASIDSPVAAKADLTVNDVPMSADITTGPLSRLQDGTAKTPWPLNVTLQGTGLRIALAGDAARPAEARGYQATIDAELGDDNPFRDAIAKIAPMRDVRFIGHVADSPSGDPAWSKLSLRGAGTSEPSGIADLTVASVALTAEDENDPVHVDVRGNFRDGPIAVSGTSASPAQYVAARQGGPLPLDLTVDYAGTRLHAKGGIGSYPTLSGANVDLDWKIPALIDLSTASRVLLPNFRDVALAGRVADAGGSLFEGISLKGFKLTAPVGDLSGDVEWIYFGRPSLRATINSQRLDANGLGGVLRAILPPSEAPPPPRPAPPPDVVASTRAAAGSAKDPANPTLQDLPPPPADVRPFFSNRAIPVGFIRDTDMDIVVHLADLGADGGDYTNVVAHVFDTNGDMTVEPLSARYGGASLDGKFGVNASAKIPTFLASVSAPGVAIAPLLPIFGLPANASGVANVKLAFQGTGDTPHRLAAALDGGFTVSVSDAEIGNDVLTRAFGDALRGARLPDSFGTGRAHLRCFAMRGIVQQGDMKVPTLALESSSLALQGNGEINLGDERIGLRVRSAAKAGGKEISVPLRIGGSFTAPRGSIDALEALNGLAEKNSGDVCPAALASVRNVTPDVPPADASKAAPAPPPSSAAAAARPVESAKPEAAKPEAMRPATAAARGPKG